MGFLTFNREHSVSKVSAFKAVEKVSKEQFMADSQLRKEQMSRSNESHAATRKKQLLKKVQIKHKQVSRQQTNILPLTQSDKQQSQKILSTVLSEVEGSRANNPVNIDYGEDNQIQPGSKEFKLTNPSEVSSSHITNRDRENHYGTM